MIESTDFWGLVKSILSDLGQVQFFVYEWIIITAVVVLKNNITLRRIKLAAVHATTVFTVIEFSQWYRMRVVLQKTYTFTDSTVLTSLALGAIVLSFWSAYIIETTATKQQGWLYDKCAEGICAIVAFMLKTVFPWIVCNLEKLEQFLRARAKQYNPMSEILEQLQSAEESK